MEVKGEEESLFLCCHLGFVSSLSQLVCIKLKGLLEMETKRNNLASNIFQTNSASAHLPRSEAGRCVCFCAASFQMEALLGLSK